jgi:ABC-type lipoprotein export system ATPase subunit
VIDLLLECKDLIKIYPSPIEGLHFPALRGLDLVLDEREMISIIGPSGSGKSTLIRMLGAYDQPSSGEVWFKDKLVNQFSGEYLNEYHQDVGVMHQSPTDNLIFGLSVIDNIMLPMHYSGKFSGKEIQRAQELLEHVGLGNKGNRKPSELSGGEQQRVSIAVALANEPTLLLADEPTGELDSHTTNVIIDYFRQLQKDLGLTLCVVTHDKRFARSVDRTYRIQDGRITTVHLRPDEGDEIDIQDEIILVDAKGNLRLPQNVLKTFSNLNAVRVHLKGNKIELVPYKKSNNRNRKRNEERKRSA